MSEQSHPSAAAAAPPTLEERATPDRAEGPHDSVLVERVRKGDRDAFSLLVHRHHGSLGRIAARYVSTRQSAKEVAQDAGVGVLEGLGRFDGRSSFRTWLFTIVVNGARTRGVREGRSVPFSAMGDGAQDSGPSMPPSRFNAEGRWAEPPAQRAARGHPHRDSDESLEGSDSSGSERRGGKDERHDLRSVVQPAREAGGAARDPVEGID